MVIFSNDSAREDSKQHKQNESIYDRRYHDDHPVPEFLDVFLALGDLNIYEPETRDGTDYKRVHEIGDGYGEIIARQIASEDQGPENVAREIHDVSNDHVEEDNLLRLASYGTHFSNKHHQKYDDAYDIRFNIKHSIIHFHKRIIASTLPRCVIRKLINKE